MKPDQIAAQLYTLRDHLKTVEDVATTLRKVREIGYTAVQVSGLSAPLSSEELKVMLDDAGLVCCATHEPTSVILDEPLRVVERLHALDCRYTAVPHPGAIPLDTLAAIKAFAARIAQAGTVLHENGLALTYHNHANEFARVEGHLVLDVIYEETTPQQLGGEIDTYWVQYGGGDPVAWCRKLSGRLPLIHLKDYVATLRNEAMFCEVGAGNLDFGAICAAAETAGCEWFIVEQDTTPSDPLDSLRQSYDYLVTTLCSR